MLQRAMLCAMLIASGCATSRPAPAVLDDPTVAYPFSETTLRRTDVSACMARLLEGAGYGNLPFESAAFLTIDAGDRFDCRVWPATHEHHAAAWAGAPPEGTAAVVHTHPARIPAPSPHDVQQAKEIGVPVIVVTPKLISMVSPRDGKVTTFGR